MPIFWLIPPLISQKSWKFVLCLYRHTSPIIGNFQTINTPASGLHRHELLFLALGLVRYGQLQQAPLYHRENVPCHEIGNGDIILEAFFQFAACPWPCAKIKDTLLERGQGFFFFRDSVVQRNAEHSVGAFELGWPLATNPIFVKFN